MTYPGNSIAYLLLHAGVPFKLPLLEKLSRKQKLLLDSSPVSLDTPGSAGSIIKLTNYTYRIIPGGGEGRLQLLPYIENPDQINTPVKVHCGYHKGLTEYFKKIYGRLSQFPLQLYGSFQHYFHRADFFYQTCRDHSLCSLSGHMPDLKRFADIRIVRIIRDPRDLLISGYFYHKRAAEHWCALTNPTNIDWLMVDGVVPADFPAGDSLTSYLNRVPLEEGLLAELEFRQKHFASMRQWPHDEKRIRTYRYEDFIGHEAEVIDDIVQFFAFNVIQRNAGHYYAKRYSAGNRKNSAHIRNPVSGQWQKYFTEAVMKQFEDNYGDLLDQYHYR